MSSVICDHSDRHNYFTIYILHICRSRYSPSYNYPDYLIVLIDTEIPVADALTYYRNRHDSTVFQKQRSYVQKLDKTDLPVYGLYAAIRWVWFSNSIVNSVGNIFVNIATIFCFGEVLFCDHVMFEIFAANTSMVNDGIYNNNLHYDISWNLCVCNKLQRECFISDLERYQENVEKRKVFYNFVISLETCRFTRCINKFVVN